MIYTTLLSYTEVCVDESELVLSLSTAATMTKIDMGNDGARRERGEQMQAYISTLMDAAGEVWGDTRFGKDGRLSRPPSCGGVESAFFVAGPPLLRRRLCRTLTQAHASAICPQYGTPQGTNRASSTNKVEIECARQCPASCHVRSARGGQCRVGGLSTGIKPENSGGQGTRLLCSGTRWGSPPIRHGQPAGT